MPPPSPLRSTPSVPLTQGAGVVSQLRRLGWGVPPAVYVSHNHTDHSGERRVQLPQRLPPSARDRGGRGSGATACLLP
jgi:hypothetical protein